jgi:predicted secreted protein
MFRILLLAVVTVCGHALGGCGQSPSVVLGQDTGKDAVGKTSVAAPAKTVTLTEDASGKTVTLAEGGQVVIRLAGNPTTGYSWGESAITGEAVRQDGPQRYEAEAALGRVGSGGVFEWKLVAAKAGRSVVKLEYRRPWEKDKPAEKTFTVTLEVEAKMTVENNFQIEVTTTKSPQNFICRFDITTPGTGRTLHVDWGDGSATDYDASIDASHTYATAGVYTIRMSGYVNRIDFFIGFGRESQKLITAIKTPIRGITGLNSAMYMFKHCENIPSIPEGLFDQCPDITTFYDTFIALRKITSIPPGLFDKQKNVTSFFATFFKCERLKEIPPGLFDKHPNNRSFAWTFGMCYSLTSVPAGLFDRHTKVGKFDHVFFRCTALRSIPPLLFDKNTNVTDYSKAFEDCRELTVSPVNSAGKKLWELSPTPTGTDCFLNCTKLTDYAAIPDNWK